jgi:gamma-glutamyl-gamma-aminobutyrate hydrolase PuuD
VGRPIVGIIGFSVDVGDARTRDPKLIHSAAMTTYVKAVAASGAMPVVVPVLDPRSAPDIVESLDAVIITGGTDVDPARYGAARDERTWEPDFARDEAEIAVARAAVEADRPLLAICRGVQVLNVALGGTLIQHLDHHMDRDRYNEDAHLVRIEPSSRLAHIVGTASLGTNTLHHQAIDGVAPGVRAVAWAPDGTIEAIEVDGALRVLGVQWHPELLRHRPEHLALFRSLLG